MEKTATNTETLLLVDDGVPQATILIAPNPTSVTHLAAKELQYCIWQITGVTLPISNQLTETTGIPIYLGDLARTVLGVEKTSQRNIGEIESLVYDIYFLPGAIILYGQDTKVSTGVEIDYSIATDQQQLDSDKLQIPGMFDQQGTLWAVYDFLERFCGVRFYGPKAISVVFSRCPTLEIIPENIQRRPAIPHISGSLTWDWPLMKGQFGSPSNDAIRLYERRMRLGGIPWQTNHTLHSYPERFPKSRYPQFYGGEGFEKLCYSSDALARQVAQDAQDYFEGAEALGLGLPQSSSYYPVVPEDAAQYCQCIRCLQSLEPHQNDVSRSKNGVNLFNDGRASHLWFKFVNKVAKLLAKTHPDKFISTLAYENYFWYPEGIQLEANIAIAPCLAVRNHWHLDYRQNELEQYALWAAESRPLFLWNYYCFPEEAAVIQQWQCFPGFMAHYLEQIIKGYARDDVKGVFLCGIGEQVDFYITIKLYNDPLQSVDDLLDEFFSLYFGPASEPMQTFYTLIEQIYSTPQNWDQDGGFHQTEVMAWGRLGTQERMKQLEQLIEKAEKLAIEQKFSERVRYWKEGIWNYMREGRRNYLCGES